MQMINETIITVQESGERIDALLTVYVEGLTRNAAQTKIEREEVLVNGKPVKKNYKCVAGDNISVHNDPPQEIGLIPQDIPLDVIFEDNDIIVVNKQRGLVVHPAPGHADGTLVNALLFHCGDTLSGIGGEMRPGIVHRIDKDTSGLIISAKNDAAHQFLSAQLSDHSLYRVYDAVVRGNMKEDSGTIDRPIGRHPTDRKKMAIIEKNGREAITHWKVVNRYKGYTHIRCRLETGRTHQIRVHMASIGHPLLGDYTYGAASPDKGLEGQCLHASELRFIHPVTKEEMHLYTNLPDYFESVISRLGAVK